jgi:hypothetical protein
VLRRVLEHAMQRLIEAEAATQIGAQPHERALTRTAYRNGGSRHRSDHGRRLDLSFGARRARGRGGRCLSVAPLSHGVAILEPLAAASRGSVDHQERVLRVRPPGGIQQALAQGLEVDGLPLAQPIRGSNPLSPAKRRASVGDLNLSGFDVLGRASKCAQR